MSRSISRLVHTLASVAALLLLVPAAQAADPDADLSAGRPNITPVRVDKPPVIDGVLDDAVWQQKPQIDNFRQTQPVLNAEPSERTSVWMAYDADNVYVAIRAYDSEPAKVIATELRRDGDLEANDQVVVYFDTFGDHRNAYVFGTNASGVLVDGRIENNEWNAQWNGIWDTKSRLDAEGWTVEMVIPVKTLSFDTDSDQWGFEVVRRIRRKNQRMRWANISQNRNDTYAPAFGTLTGITGLQQGLGLEFVPTFAIQTTKNRPLGTSDQLGVVGGDITYRITPSLTATATINTDFSDAPVDQVQNNLGRFSLFFPETRDFFLSDADIFQFGGLNENGIPFFSRKMGILNNGSTVSLDLGTKLTGRVGDLNIGVLNTQMEGQGALDSQSLSVVRVSTGVLSESRVGMIYTDGDPNSNNGSSLYGADFQYRNSNVFGGNVIVGDAWVQQSNNPGIKSDDMAWGMRVNYPNDKIQLSGFVYEFEPNFDPKLGFANRTGIRHYETEGRLRKRNDGKARFRLLDWGFRLSRIEDMNGKVQTEEKIMKIFEIQNQVNDRVETNYINVHEVLDKPFQISKGIWLPIGDYKFTRHRLRFQTNPGRLLSAEIMTRFGDFWTGTVKEYAGTIDLRPSPKFFARYNYQVVDAKLPQGNFDFTVNRVNIDFNLTPRLMWQNFIQHNSVTKTVGWNSRLRWEMDPGNILFLVLNQGWEIEDGSYMPLVTNFTAKVRWNFRF